MLSRFAVLPDEMDRGFLGRVMRFNGLPDKRGTLQALRVWAGLPADGGEGLRTGTVALLSQLADIPLVEFVAQHTTLPWRRAITPHKSHIDHGGDQSESIVSISALRLARDAAYFCVDCVAEDQATHGFSYWRRSHQLPGCQECAQHHTTLVRAADQWGFLKSPAAFIHAEAAEVEATENWGAHSLVLRFNAIAQALMARDLPVSSTVMRQLLHHKGQQKNLQVCGGEVKRPLLSDLVLRSFPREWLKEVFPAVLAKRKGELLSKLDGVFYFASGASTVEASFLAMAMLFDSADEALQALEQFEARPVTRSSRSASEAPAAEELITAYIETSGRYSAVATRCGTSIFMVSKRLAALGLPNFARGRQGAGLLAAGHAFYVNQRGLIESAAIGAVSVVELETLVRSAGPVFFHALRAIAAKEEHASLAA